MVVRRRLIAALSLLGCLASLSAGDPKMPPAQSLKKGEAVKVKVYRVDLDRQNRPVVFLHDSAGKRFLPIWIGTCEARAISRKLHQIDFPRPFTHDLFQSVLAATGIRITSILVDQLRPLDEGGGGVYFAILTLQQSDGSTLQIDSRPSDAMALSVRMDTPVYVARKILEENGLSKREILALLDHAPQWIPKPHPKEAPKAYY